MLGSLGTYYFSIFKAPVKVLKTLESKRRRFLWGGSEEKQKISWVAWKTVILDKERGGLGVGSMKAAKMAFLAKWWPRYKNGTCSLWVKFITAVNRGTRKWDSIPLKTSLGGTWKN